MRYRVIRAPEKHRDYPGTVRQDKCSERTLRLRSTQREDYDKTSTFIPSRMLPLFNGITFCPKMAPSLCLRYLPRVLSGSLLCSSVSLSIVVTTQRAQGFTTANSTPPILILFQVSSSNGSQPLTTIFGRKRFIGTGDSKCEFRSSSPSSDASRIG